MIDGAPANEACQRVPKNALKTVDYKLVMNHVIERVLEDATLDGAKTRKNSAFSQGGGGRLLWWRCIHTYLSTSCSSTCPSQKYSSANLLFGLE